MTPTHLHIISFDVPYPPDYGGVVDVFFKITALSALGVKIHLHCFQYGREKASVLEKYCHEVNYYPRKTTKLKLFSRLPYIVSSRESEAMMTNLLKDQYPILMEGLHSTLYIKDNRLSGRKIIVRSHNIEHNYYWQLAAIEKNPFRKWYFTSEARKLEVYEPVIEKANYVATISPAEHNYINSRYSNSFYLPAFHPNEKVNSMTGTGSYALYHGNLAVGENNKAALFLIEEVFNEFDFPLIIAGNNPSAELVKAVNENKKVQIKTNLGAEEMQRLIMDAQINILPTFQSTGIKLKLVNALFSGRFCIANKLMVEGTGLETLCVVADSAAEMKKAIQQFKQKDFAMEMIKEREEVLQKQFNNTFNARSLMEKFFDTHGQDWNFMV